jgi:AcrR family transcriptional regulator
MRMGTADLRRTVLDASLELIEAEGLAALSMREVARRAGVSHQAPYHHFGDREGILAALAADGFSQLHDDMQKAIASTKSRSKRIEAVGNAYIEFALKYPGYFKIMFRSELVDLDRFDDVRKIADETFALVTSVVEPASPSRGANDPQLVSITAWAIAHGIATLLLEGKLSRRFGKRRSAQRAGAAAVLKVFAELLS